MPEGWVQTPKTNTTTGSTAGALISWNDPTNPEDATAGYGYIADDTTDVEDIYYFHSDHLGSTSYVTDKKGNITQYDAYLPYGELLVDEHSSSEDMPYKFNGKEMDEETGLYYYGARYMNPMTSVWYGVDALAYPKLGSYLYCYGNPIKLVDPNGEDPNLANLIGAAEKLGVGVATIRSVFQTETNGHSYAADGRVQILYERHYFSRLTKHLYDNDRDISYKIGYKKTTKVNGKSVPTPTIDHYGGLPNQYRRLDKAKKLNKEAAYASVSYGSFQIMGANYKAAGYNSAKEFGEAMLSADENTMLDAFTNFVSADPRLVKALKELDWKTFAYIYNGSNYKDNHYDEKMERNYNKYKDDPYQGYVVPLQEVQVIGKKKKTETGTKE